MSITRRGFLKGFGVGATATTIGANVEASPHFIIPPDRPLLHIEPVSNPIVIAKDLLVDPHQQLIRFNGDYHITGQGLYSALKHLWKEIDGLRWHSLPMLGITPVAFEFQENWGVSKGFNKIVRASFTMQGMEFTGVDFLGPCKLTEVYYGEPGHWYPIHQNMVTVPSVFDIKLVQWNYDKQADEVIYPVQQWCRVDKLSPFNLLYVPVL